MTATLESLYPALDQLSYRAMLKVIVYLTDPYEDADLTDEEWLDKWSPVHARRLQLMLANPSRGIPWEEVSARLKEQFG